MFPVYSVSITFPAFSPLMINIFPIICSNELIYTSSENKLSFFLIKKFENQQHFLFKNLPK